MSIIIENLTHIYNKGTAFEKAAVKNINIEIAKGEFAAIIGHTGSGKSTLVQHFNALIKPSSGRVLLDGFDIHSDKSRLKETRSRVGLVFQYPEHQLFEMTVAKDVAFGPENMGLGKAETEARVRESLALVGIGADMYEKSPFELSGGQKRRVAIAGVLAMRPEVLVLDEPAAGLDPSGRDEIFGAIKNMRGKLGITVILVSHSMEDVARLAEKIYVMRDGEIAMSGTPAEVFARYAELEDMGLAAPQITYLAGELEKRGARLGGTFFTVGEAAGAVDRWLRGPA